MHPSSETVLHIEEERGAFKAVGPVCGQLCDCRAARPVLTTGLARV